MPVERNVNDRYQTPYSPFNFYMIIGNSWYNTENMENDYISLWLHLINYQFSQYHVYVFYWQVTWELVIPLVLAGGGGRVYQILRAIFLLQFRFYGFL